MLCYQGMVVLAGNQVWWTWEVEDVFQKVQKGDKMGMKNHAKKMHKQIDELVVKVEGRNTRVNHFPSNGAATDPMKVFFGVFNAFKYWCSLFSLKYIVLKLK